MNYNSNLKSQAKQIIRTAKPSVIVAGIIYIIITYVLTALLGKLLGANMSLEAIEKYQNFIQNGQFDSAMMYAQSLMPSTPAGIIEFLLSALGWIINAGFIIFLLNTVRATGKACYGNLLDGFSIFFRVFILTVLESIFIFLWTLLFIVPGIIAAYKYRQAIYILIDHPELSPLDCIRASKQMMDGHKGDLFLLDFSFIGWFLLALIPFVEIWVTPYTSTTYALFYEALRQPRVEYSDQAYSY